MKKLDTKVCICYGDQYVCTTHTTHEKRTLRDCLRVFIETGKGSIHSYYSEAKKVEETAGRTFDEKKFKAYFDDK